MSHGEGNIKTGQRKRLPGKNKLLMISRDVARDMHSHRTWQSPLQQHMEYFSVTVNGKREIKGKSTVLYRTPYANHVTPLARA
jgi:hypothetical protein